jgi:hypothetical protein
MHLNLPVIEQLSACRNLLIAGMGGGFDIFCGLPIYFELRERGMNVHLANYSFSDIEPLKTGIRLTDTLVGVNADVTTNQIYFPEWYLAQWFRAKRNEEITIWCFQQTGVRPLIDNYVALVEHLGIDGILLIDGGVDSLLRGDEFEIGTLLEDSLSLIAVSELKNVPLRMIACIGFGAEQEMTYAHVFENMAALAQLDAFLGSCSLVRAMSVYQDYEDAQLFVQSRPQQAPSVINSSVISAVHGEYGNHHLTEKTRGSKLWISPLMPVYWFYQLQAVARRNLLFTELRRTDTLAQAYREVLKVRQTRPRRKQVHIPLP